MRSHRPLARLESWQGKLVGGELEVAHKHRGRQNLDAGVAEVVGRHRLVHHDRQGVGRPGFQPHSVLLRLAARVERARRVGRYQAGRAEKKSWPGSGPWRCDQPSRQRSPWPGESVLPEGKLRCSEPAAHYAAVLKPGTSPSTGGSSPVDMEMRQGLPELDPQASGADDLG